MSKYYTLSKNSTTEDMLKDNVTNHILRSNPPTLLATYCATHFGIKEPENNPLRSSPSTYK